MRTLWITCCLLLCSSAAPLLAQDAKIKPVLITAMAPVDDLLADADYLTRVFAAADAGKMMRQVAGPLLGGIDRKRPWGAYVTLVDGEDVSIGFIPVTSLKVQLTILEEQIGKAEEQAGGIFKVALPAGVAAGGGGPSDLYLKEQDGWAFYSDKAENLATLPKDPVALLGGLEKKYDLGTRFLVENVSAVDRQKFIDDIKKQFEEGRLSPDVDAEKVPPEIIASFEQAILRYAEGTKSIDFGFTVDAKQANVALSVAIEPIAGTELAKSLASVQTLSSPHAGVLVPGSAVVIHRVAKLTKDEIAVWDIMMDQMLKEAKDSPQVPPEKQALAKEAMPLLERMIKAAHADGRVDWGTSYLLSDEGKLTTIAGGHLAGLKELEADFRTLLEKHKDSDPDLAKVNIEWDFAKHGKVRIIKFTPPKDTPHDSSLLGEDPSVYLGVDGDYLYLANGHDSLKQLKEAVDRAALRPNFKGAPFRMRIDVRPLVRLAVNKLGGEDPLVATLMKKLDGATGKTSIHMNLLPGEAGLEGRFEIGEGVLTIMPEVGQLIWQTFMSAGQPMPDAPGATPQF